MAAEETQHSPKCQLATRGQRFAAALFDVLIFAALGGVAALVVPRIAGHSAILCATSLTIIASVFVVSTNLWLLANHGATIGKRLVGIRTTRCDGSRASIWRLVLLRGLPLWAVALMPYINLLVPASLLLIFRADRRCLHDYLADTIVVKA